MLKTVTVKTLNWEHQNERNVTLIYDEKHTRLLGALNHNTGIVIDQELVDALQEVVNFQKGSQNA